MIDQNLLDPGDFSVWNQNLTSCCSSQLGNFILEIYKMEFHYAENFIKLFGYRPIFPLGPHTFVVYVSANPTMASEGVRADLV